MASASASVSPDVKKERLSFAKIAAAGMKPASNAQSSNNNNNNATIQQPHDTTTDSRDAAPIISASNGSSQPITAPKPKKIVQLVSRNSVDEYTLHQSKGEGPEVHVQTVESVPQPPRQNAQDGSLVPTLDDLSTQVSSSSGSNKPPSLDGKSVASGTTFALDEKDSLRPDDSASVKAVEEDDMFSPPGSGLPGSRLGSDDGVRLAFRDQIREITSVEARGRPQILGGAPRGVLYVPPQGPGIGAVPSMDRTIPDDGADATDCPPDQKLLDALESPRDRVWVLKLEQDVIDFVKDPKESSMTLPQCHSFYRLLAHKMADYYMLGHHIEDTSAAVRLFKTPDCRVPPPLTGITAPSTAASTPPPTAPQMKILRRGDDKGPAIANGSNMPSKSGSENGDSGDEKKQKGPATREEREARYEAARLRIMGSAKPLESGDASKDKQDSRASSTTGKKNKKNKARVDDDDGFEARSAYANFYAPPYSSEPKPQTQSSFSFPDFTDGTSGQFVEAYAPGGLPVNPHVLSQVDGSASWAQHSYEATNAWPQGQPSGYDLPSEFQRSMGFQNQASAQSPSHVGYGQSYGQQYYGAPQNWSQQQYPMPAQPSQSASGYGWQPQISYNQPPPDQSYAFGQLPSQAFPGSTPSKSEHPLPGSYKGKHFNPQSQTFVPGQANGRPYTPHQATGSNNTFTPSVSSPSQLQRQTSTQSQSPAFGSPHHNPAHQRSHQSPHAMQSRSYNQPPLTHPLPQPVFARHPSPNLPLPPKPGPVPPQQQQQQPMFANGISSQNQQGQPSTQNQSVFAKFGTPASLPAKPPPSIEPFDPMKMQSMSRPQFNNAGAGSQARLPSIPSPAYPTFGSVPQPGPGPIVNGTGGYSGSRRM